MRLAALLVLDPFRKNRVIRKNNNKSAGTCVSTKSGLFNVAKAKIMKRVLMKMVMVIITRKMNKICLRTLLIVDANFTPSFTLVQNKILN